VTRDVNPPLTGKYSGNAGQQFDVAQHDERAAAAAAPVSTLVQVTA
jgi:hypothetical protein